MERSGRKTLVFVALCLLALAKGFQSQKISYENMRNGDEAADDVLKAGLMEVGMVSVKDVPGLAQLRKDTLIAASECALHTKSTTQRSLQYIFPDGTSRYTLGAKTISGKMGVIEGADLTFQACAAFVGLQEKFRSIVHETTEHFVQAIDRVQGEKRVLMSTENAKDFQSVSDLFNHGNQLEHFHTYERFSGIHEADEFTFEMHVDEGLFIALIPAVILSGTRGNDFFIKLKSGEIVAPDFGEGDEIVFMIGQGFEDWVNPKLSFPFRPTPHAMKMPKTDASSFSIRSWYGKMVLPSDDSILPTTGKSFYHFRAANNDRKLQTWESFTACSSSMSSSLHGRMAADTCAEDLILCWTVCQAEPTCDDGFAAACATEDNGTFTLCDSCGPLCVPNDVLNPPTPAPTRNNAFCSGTAVTMSMLGFIGAGKPDDDCINFLFESYTLDSKAKFGIACVLTVVIGMFTEFSVRLRRSFARFVGSSNSITTQFGKLTLYALQLTFGYVAMLIAMTYSIPLFFLIIVGLTIGHLMFNFNSESKKKTKEDDNCCCCEEPKKGNLEEKQDKVEVEKGSEPDKDSSSIEDIKKAPEVLQEVKIE